MYATCTTTHNVALHRPLLLLTMRNTEERRTEREQRRKEVGGVRSSIDSWWGLEEKRKRGREQGSGVRQNLHKVMNKLM